jgi:hypothetical protein
VPVVKQREITSQQTTAKLDGAVEERDGQRPEILQQKHTTEETGIFDVTELKEKLNSKKMQRELLTCYKMFYNWYSEKN